MRQRLLLVAGWLVAAVGSGIVASGAVAVAGGQVLDRAQRPFTAAEVAALPVVTVGSPDDVEPHASGGLVPSAGEPTDTNGGVEGSDGAPTTGSRGSSASDDDTSPLDPFSSEPARARIETNEGGGASFAVADDRLILLWATPTPGYVVQRRINEPTHMTVSFTSSRNVWVIEAELRDGDLLVRSSPVPLT